MPYRSDAAMVMKRMREGCVDMVLTDLPSGETRAAFDNKPNVPELFEGLRRVLKPNGVMVLMASSLPFAAELIKHGPFRYDLIWSKSLPTGFLNASRRPLRAHEYMLHFCYSGTSTYNPQKIEGCAPIHRARRRGTGENYNNAAPSESRAGATDRYPVSVLEFSSVGTSSKARTHPQQKPVPLLRWLVRAFSNSGDVIFDPFAGSGSTVLAAEAEGRVGAGVDLNFGTDDMPPALRALLEGGE